MAEFKELEEFEEEFWNSKWSRMDLFLAEKVKKQQQVIEQQRTELIERKKYEGFLRSVIKAGKTLKDHQDFNWFVGKK
jgi:hypothetical protein